MPIGGARQQTVLAMLLLSANRTVSVERLVDAAYGDDRPATARAQVQISTSTLRRAFATRGLLDVIATYQQGYAINVPAQSLDFQHFEDLVLAARHARTEGRADEAVNLYRKALSLWRGEAFSGIESRPVRIAAGRIAECRVMSNEDCIQLELDLGRHRELIGELTELVAAHPLRERLRGQLMTALYRCGRDAEALQVYRDGRRILIEELGIEPPKRLQQLEHAILTGDHDLAVPAGAGTAAAAPAAPAIASPRMLPTDIADFTDQAATIGAIERHLQVGEAQPTHFAVPVVVVSGKSGVGKTALAVHLGHRIAEHFPDGQLFADLHGTDSAPVPPSAVLERFLRVLGVPGTMLPEGQEERAEVFRALLATRRVLLVLDNAASEGQVLPLLPGNPGCAVVVTSGSRLAALPGAMRVELDVFDPRASVELLTRILGAERVSKEQAGAEKLVELCGGLPLALRIAGARLSARPNWSIGLLVERLESDTRRLDELNHGEMGVRASLSLSYRNIGEPARRLFRQLAILDRPSFSAWMAAAILDRPFAEAYDLLDQLTDAHLVETVDTGRRALSRYRMHDLVRVFARERLAVEDSYTERVEVLARVLRTLLVVAATADRRVYGVSSGLVPDGAYDVPAELVEQLVESPRLWFEQERRTLVAATAQAARAGLVDLCWGLAISTAGFFQSRSYFGDWRETHEVALAAARQVGDRRGQAAILCSLGALSMATQRFTEARKELIESLHLFRELSDDRGGAWALSQIGHIDRLCGHLEGAASHCDQALSTLRRIHDNAGAAHVLHDLAALCIERDQPDEAMRLLGEAQRLNRDGDSRYAEARIAHRLGHTYLMTGKHTAALSEFRRALQLAREIGNPLLEAAALYGLGVTHLGLGKPEEADNVLSAALTLAELSDQRFIRVLALKGLGDLALARREPARATDLLRKAHAVVRELGMPLHEARTLLLLGEAHLADGDKTSAREAFLHAFALAAAVDASLVDPMRSRLRDRLRARPRGADDRIDSAGGAIHQR
ncbi:AfsR/SARP family transcriptional regulator [Phytohabitans sp. LJ34]|uniref:AfsR/SARP family transcriptional regulator n=1 Tax=Phytohabitans sp. LJ34 TaxID=3452217 RepID=UPI003F8A9580